MAELDKKDRALLYELDCNSRTSFVELGKRLNMTPEGIRYRFQRLQDEAILTSCHAILDSGKLGFMQYKLFLKVQSVTEDDFLEIINFAKRSDLVLRIIRFDGGPYDLDIVTKVEHVDELDRFLRAIVGKFSAYIRRRSVAVNVWARYLSRSYLTGKARSKGLERGYGSTRERQEVDPINRFILKTLASDSRASATDISEALEKESLLAPLSSFAVGKRIEALQRDRFITGYAITIENSILNQVCFKVLLFFNAMTEADEKRFTNHCLRHPNVVHFMKVLGEWDYELDIEVPTMRDLERIILEISRDFPRAIRDYITLHYMKTYKYRFLNETRS